MKFPADERLQQIINAHQNACRHLMNAIGELRRLADEQNVIKARKYPHNPFHQGNHIMTDLSKNDEEQYLRNLSRSCWNDLLAESECLNEMPESIKNDLLDSIEKGEFGEFEESNIRQKLAMLQNRHGEFLHAILIQSYHFLCPRPASQRLPIAGKAVVRSEYLGSLSFVSGHYDSWRNVEKAMLLLDGKELPNDCYNELPRKLQDAFESSQDSFECDYFTAKFYSGSKTVHLYFKRLDLIEKINQAGICA